jgi:PAS domain S-box-containing protein
VIQGALMDDQPQSGPAPESVLWQREIFELLVERVKDYAIFLVDLQGRVASWNLGARLVKGYKADEIIGQPMTCFYLPEDIQANLPMKLLETARMQGRVEVEGWRLRKDGSPFWANVVITALRDESGILVSYAKVTRDLTDRHRIGQELEQLRRDLESHVEELALSNADLAKRTQQVTALNSELQDKLVDLETFFDVATDRELTMMNLEQQIQRLMKENELLRTTSSKPLT